MGFYFSYDASNIYKVIKKNINQERLETMYSEKELHCTLLYSDDQYDSKYQEISFPGVKTTIQSLEIWQSHNGYVLVARLDDKNLKKYNQTIKDNYHIKDSHPIFKPHITLQKHVLKSQLIEIKKMSFLIGKEVILNNFNCLMAKPKINNSI